MATIFIKDDKSQMQKWKPCLYCNSKLIFLIKTSYEANHNQLAKDRELWRELNLALYKKKH